MEQSNTPFDITPSAAARIAHLLQDEPVGAAFVVEVQGGGCSGFQYHFDLKIPEIAEDSLVIERDGAKVVVDATSLELLNGSVLDYTEDLAQAGFAIKNPNATAKCGCGNSFSVAL
jgi:iron-sulfur cluster insertion protein